MPWTTFCRRTCDPKAGYLEHLLTQRGIPHQRNGYSAHGPIIEVPADRLDEAEALLVLKARKDLGLPVRAGVSLDDVPDGHRCFIAPDFNPREYDYDSCWALFPPTDFIPDCKEGEHCGACAACREAYEDPNDYAGMGWVSRAGTP